MATAEAFSWVNESPLTQQPNASGQKAHSGYRPRRVHTKSRKGCQNCRRLKIKCDEARPSCGQCLDRLLGSLQCNFAALQKPAAEVPGLLQKETSKPSAYPASADDQLVPYLEHAGIPIRYFTDPMHRHGDALELLNHFVTATTPWVGSPILQQIIQQNGMGLCFDAPYLMHAILAFSASHLGHWQPGEKAYGLAFRQHYSLSLSSYSSQLQTSLDTRNADAIVASSYLHSMLAFRNAQSEDGADVNAGFTWLRAMRGVAVMWNISDIHAHLKGSIWREMKRKSGVLGEVDCNHTESNQADSWATATSIALHALFESDCTPDTYRDSYKGPLTRLCRLMRCGMGHDSICMFMAFVGDLPSSFLVLLDRRDPRAMLILCYWSALLSDIDQWWIVGSANAVCRRLCTRLHAVPERRIRELLRFPASKSGYEMRNLQ